MLVIDGIPLSSEDFELSDEEVDAMLDDRKLPGFPRGADEGTRTPDPLLTMEVLYRLSYVGAGASLIGWSGGSRIRTCVG
jgi:hypothetical protein